MKAYSLYQIRRGYTLVEMVVVIAVLGIAGLMLIPNLVDRNTFAIQAASRTIVSDIVFAQSDALANQEYRRVQFIESEIGDTGYTGFCVIRVTPATFFHPFDPDAADYVYDPMASGSEDGRYIVNFADDGRFGDVKITSVDLDSGMDFITFDEFGGSVSSSGGIPGTGGEIELESNDGYRYRISVAPFTGKTTVEVLLGP